MTIEELTGEFYSSIHYAREHCNPSDLVIRHDMNLITSSAR